MRSDPDLKPFSEDTITDLLTPVNVIVTLEDAVYHQRVHRGY